MCIPWNLMLLMLMMLLLLEVSKKHLLFKHQVSKINILKKAFSRKSFFYFFQSSIQVCSASIQSSSSFIQGIANNSSPPFEIKSSLALIPISSSVSKQSDTNAGVTTAIFLTPFLAKLSISTSVYGSSHLSPDNLDW